MGFRKSNYTIEELGLTIPEAYAVIRNLYINGETGTAEFVIQATRDKALGLAPLKTVHIQFEVKRDENPYTTAYNFAKSEEVVTRGKTTTRHPRPFFGWQDDIR